MSKIEWTDKTWNPIVGCSHASAGCKNCYAERMACRLACMGQEKYKQVLHPKTHLKFILRGKWNGKTAFVESALEKPLHWKTPLRVFVCSMSDLFHSSVPFEWIDRVMFTIYRGCEIGHTLQILTKQPERMKEYFWGDVDARILELFKQSDTKYTSEHRLTSSINLLPNVWLGTTVEHPDYKYRIDELRKIPAAFRFLSFEPLLADPGKVDLDGIDWVIAGGESGPGARPMHPDWARGLRDQCKDAGVPFFFKQWGKFVSPKQTNYQGGGHGPNKEWRFPVSCTYMKYDGTYYPGYPSGGISAWTKIYGIGKKKAGCLLDGVEHKEFPGAKK